MVQPHAPPAAPAAPAPPAAAARPKYFKESLEKDIKTLKKEILTRPAPDAEALCKNLKLLPYPGPLPSLSLPDPPSGTTYHPDPNRITIIIPTGNADKVNVVVRFLKSGKAGKPGPVSFASHCEVPAKSGVGEQPYDDAGPRGAFTRVVSAVTKLQRDTEYLAKMAQGGVGTVLVGSVENFMSRELVDTPEGEVMMAVDYGFVVFCRIPLTGKDRKWEWKVGASRGVTAPVEYWRAAEKQGFDDGAGKKHGKVTVGQVLEDNIPEIKAANWHKVLADESRYDLLREAMEEMVGRMGRMGRMGVPWPVSSAASVAGTGVAPAANVGAGNGGAGRGGAGNGRVPGATGGRGGAPPALRGGVSGGRGGLPAGNGGGGRGGPGNGGWGGVPPVGGGGRGGVSVRGAGRGAPPA
ncbi:hypothetical protein C8A01DRAFT_14821 [Parachaetomium inaequale]|uniref:Uncharacterized protein n=1 Tax=Parachaetomium inaequale TaxID=2588326 RepID=A0AAN6PM93_9PEZI|nr:hypothetical protein C8A01DRAFT_14821 [Parachaetomium inaequale]